MILIEDKLSKDIFKPNLTIMFLMFVFSFECALSAGTFASE